MTRVTKKRPLPFSVVAGFELGATHEKSTQECFTGRLFMPPRGKKLSVPRRDEDIDELLPDTYPFAAACSMVVVRPTRTGSYPDWAAQLFRMRRESSIEGLTRHLAKRGCLMTLWQMEKIVEIWKDGIISTGLNVDGSGNFFFTANKAGGVSVGVLCRGRHCWSVSLHSFNRKILQNTTGRLFIPNIDRASFLPSTPPLSA